MQQEKELLQRKAREVLLKLASVYTPSGEEWKASHVMKEIAESLSLQLTETPSHSYIFNDGYDILLASHIDTVPGFIEPREEGGTIYGRGVVDAKGPLTAMIIAGWYLKEKGIDVSVAGLSDEEKESRGARELLDRGKRFRAVIIGEPSNTSDIVIEYRGALHLDVNCKGMAEHASSSANNLMLDLARKLIEISRLPSSYDTPSIVPTIMRCGNAMNVTPSECYIHLDCRFSVASDPNRLLEEIKGSFNNCEVSVVDQIPPVKTSSTSMVRALQRSLLRQGIKPRLVRKAGTSDMNILAQVSDEIVAYGPGESRLEHTNFEKITMEEIYISVMTYVKTIEELWQRQAKT